MREESSEHRPKVRISISVSERTYKRLWAIAGLDSFGSPNKAAAARLESLVTDEAEDRPMIDEAVELSDQYKKEKEAEISAATDVPYLRLL
jgi:hypothetical protein